MWEKVVEELENSDNAESIPKAPKLNFEELQIIFKRHLVDRMQAMICGNNYTHKLTKTVAENP
jgi:hypothetical protein